MLRRASSVALFPSSGCDAEQCCAIEGAYPSSLAYLEENYGLVVNRSDYAITYEVFADNVMPNVVVLAK